MKSRNVESALDFLNELVRLMDNKDEKWFKKYGLTYLLCAKDKIDDEIKGLRK